MKTNKFPLVYLEWCDAMANQVSWLDLDTAKEWGRNEEWLVAEVGFVIEENDQYILLAARHHPEDSTPRNNVVDGVMKIPKCWVRKRKALRY